MNQETKFCLTGKDDGMQVEIEGGAMDLTNLLASAISESKDIEMVVTMALLAVKMKGKDNDNDEDMLSKMMSSMRPKAQA